MSTLNPSKIEKTNAIMFADGETFFIPGKPNAAFSTILKFRRDCGGHHAVTEDYPGLQFGIITATIQQYHDNLATGMKDFFSSAVEIF